MLQTGALVAGYRIDRLIGQGGMGAVYEATQLSLDRTVALKIVAPELGKDPAFRERFRREGLLQAALEHPNIVTVYEAGESEHGLFLAMRLVRGATLKDLILGRELSVERTIRILEQVADALDTAHEAGLIHRDVKPHNILVTPQRRDHAYLADFGLTKGLGSGTLTLTGQLMGTLDYIAPEQILGQPATPRSDIYALGAVFFECLTGVVPFPKEFDAAVLYAHLSDPVPSCTDHRPELPKTIDAVLERALAKEPNERHASAGEFLRDATSALGEPLRAVMGVPPPIETPEEAGIRRPREVVIATRETAEYDAREQLSQDTPATGSLAVPAAPPSVPTEAAEEAEAPVAAPARGRGRVGWLAAAGVAIVAFAAAGFFSAGSSGEEQPAARSLGAGSIALTLPAGWQPSNGSPGIPGLSLTDRVAAEPRNARDGSGLVAGQTAAGAPTFLPKPLLTRLPRDANVRKETIQIGALEGFRYRNLQAQGFARRLTLYVVPQAEATTTVACFAPTNASRRLAECERIVGTLEISGASRFPLAPTFQYANALNAMIQGLEANRLGALARMRKAKTPAAQAKAADGLARAYGSAAARIENVAVTPLTRSANESLIASLEATRGSYDRLARAARRGDRNRYDSAALNARRNEARVERAIEYLKQIGFALE